MRGRITTMEQKDKSLPRPTNIYIINISTRRTILTENLLNAGRISHKTKIAKQITM